MPSKIKQIKKKTNINNTDFNNLSDLFNQMTGDSTKLDPEITVPKFLKILELLNKFKIILNIFYNHIMIKDICIDNTILIDDYEKIFNYIENLKNYIDTLHNYNYSLDNLKKENININDITLNLLYDDKKVEEFTTIYINLKKSEYINVNLEMINILQNYKKFIENDELLQSIWLSPNYLPGNIFELFPFTNLNIKFIYNFDFHNNDDNLYLKKFITNIINKLYKCSIAIYNIILEVDFDISKFTDIILNNMDRLKNELPRCERAFNTIESALIKIKTNFNKYFKDFEKTKDPSTILGNFMKDIYDNNREDPVLIGQLKKIISYFANKIKNQKNIPTHITNLISQLQKLSENNNINNNFSSADMFSTFQQFNINTQHTENNIEENKNETELVVELNSQSPEWPSAPGQQTTVADGFFFDDDGVDQDVSRYNNNDEMDIQMRYYNLNSTINTISDIPDVSVPKDSKTLETPETPETLVPIDTDIKKAMSI